jgi:hypothetical protein
MTPSTKHTYMLHSENFVKWLKGDVVPGARRLYGAPDADSGEVAIFPSGGVEGSLLVLTSLPNDLSAKEVGNLSVTHALLLFPSSL